MNPRFPVYVVSKGRWTNMLTDRALNRLGIHFTLIVEAQEYDAYLNRKNVMIETLNLKHDPYDIIILPQKYLDEYDTCDDLGYSKSKGPGSARNFAWDHSIERGAEWHWVLDDNLDDFHRLNNNIKAPVRTGATFRACEDFTLRYENVLISGMNYYSFCKSTDKVPPFSVNTRIYSCLFIKNDIPYRWRGRYNEDTDICLRVLKDGFCTIQFNAFLCGKTTTQRMRGGNSQEFYDNEGTYNKSKMLEDLHPDVAKVVKRFNRYHHHVDYSSFKENNKLIRKPNWNYTGTDNYGMKCIRIDYNDRDDFISIN